MPSEDVQVNTRVSPEERDAIKAHGGLRHIIRKFLADNSSDEEKHRQEIEKLQTKLIEIQVEINKHTESAEKLKAQRGSHRTPGKERRYNSIYQGAPGIQKGHAREERYLF